MRYAANKLKLSKKLSRERLSNEMDRKMKMEVEKEMESWLSVHRRNCVIQFLSMCSLLSFNREEKQNF